MMTFPLNYFLPRPGKFKHLKTKRVLMAFLDSIIYDRRKETILEVRGGREIDWEENRGGGLSIYIFF